MCRNALQSLWVLIVLLVGSAPGCATAAPSGESHLEKISPELRNLYDDYRRARGRGRPLVLSDPSLRVVEDRVIIDAVASGSVDELKAALVALGMRDAVATGRMVSGQLPIDAIPAMAALPTLRFARAARSTTNDRAGQGVR